LIIPTESQKLSSSSAALLQVNINLHRDNFTVEVDRFIKGPDY